MNRRKTKAPQQDAGAAQNKQADLDRDRESAIGEYLTTNQGLRISHTDDSLKAGDAGPDAAGGFPPPREDHAFRPRTDSRAGRPRPRLLARTAFSRSTSLWPSSPGRLSAGSGASRRRSSCASPRCAGSRGSADTVRDVRGFATKFYTDEGVYDLVGNNIPVFFIQDAIKFPDLIHAVKPEPHNEMPQAATAHDTFWDFFSLMPESDAHAHVGAVRPRPSAELSHDGGLRRPHLPPGQRRR